MSERLEDVWAPRDFPVLIEAVRLVDRGGYVVDAEAICRGTGIDIPEVKRSLRALERTGYLTLQRGARAVIVVDVSREAYLLTGLHPSGDDAVSALVDALRQAADLTPDPAERSRLRALADGALGVGRDVLGGVLVALASRGIFGA